LIPYDQGVKKKLLFVPVLALGILAFWLLGRGNSGPQKIPEVELARRVRILAAPRIDVVPRAIGFGVVRPGRVWNAVPEVSGRIVERAPRLKTGNIIKAGTILVRIDRDDYALEVAQAESQIQSIEAQTEQLNVRKTTMEASLLIEERSLELVRSELERVRKLVERESLAASNLDKEERNVLAQQARVQEIRNNLLLVDPDRRVLQVQKSIEQTRLAKAKLNVERTVIRAPFDCRIGAVDVERDQVVQKGQQLFSADSIATSEVTAQFPMSGIGQVFPAGDAPIDASAGGLDALLRMGLSAKVRLEAGPHTVEWDATVTRVEGIDAQTRTVGVVVSVEGSYREVRPGTRPPLVRGMYVEVVLRGPARKGLVVVPRSALHSGHVYVMGKDNRLETRPVEIAFVQASFAVVRAGLSGNEQVVLSDLYPAVSGMLLDAEQDDEAARALQADATGLTRMR